MLLAAKEFTPLLLAVFTPLFWGSFPVGELIGVEISSEDSSGVVLALLALLEPSSTLRTKAEELIYNRTVFDVSVCGVCLRCLFAGCRFGQ